MLLEALRLFVALLLLVALPGWLLVRALFPAQGSLTRWQQAYLVPAGGILVLMLLGIVLGFLPRAGSRGHFQSLATGGMPNVELAVVAASLVLFWVGAHRGAYPRASARFPALAAPWTRLKVGGDRT